MAIFYLERNKLGKAYYWNLDALRLMKVTMDRKLDTDKDRNTYSVALYTRGLLYLERDMEQKAEKYFRKGISYNKLSWGGGSSYIMNGGATCANIASAYEKKNEP